MTDVGVGGGRDVDVPLTVGAVARLLGVATPTLRTWERRYSLGPSGRSDGRHRRYTPVDVARLALMRQLTLRGATAADAARVALVTPDERLTVPDTDSFGVVDGRAEPGARSGTWAGDPPLVVVPSWTDRSVPARTDRPDGAVSAGAGRPLPERVPAQARALAGLGAALDAPGITALVADCVARQGVVSTWDAVVWPALVWLERPDGAEREAGLLLTEAVLGVLAARSAAMGGAVWNTRPVLLAGAPGETHPLALHAAAAALAERRLGSLVLGAGVAGATLVSAVARLAPSAVLVWSRLPAAAELLPAELLPAELPPAEPVPAELTAGGKPPALVAGGPGWDPADLPAGALAAPTLGRAVELLESLAV